MKRILIADDNVANCNVLRNLLGRDNEVNCAYDGVEVMTLLHGAHYDCVLLDMYMPRMDAFEILEQINSSDELKKTPVIVMALAANNEAYSRALKYGALCVNLNPCNIFGVRADVKNALKLIDGEISRDTFNEWIGSGDRFSINQLQDKEQFSRAVREQIASEIPGAFMVIDIDNMDYINTTYSREEGDKAVAAFGQVLMSALDCPALVGSMGGDEFGAFLPHMRERPQMRRCADQLLRAVRKSIKLPDKLHVVSASIGISIYPEQASDYSTLFDAADNALTYVKNNDRNAFRIFDRRDTAIKRQDARIENTFSNPESLLKGRVDESRQAWVKFGEFRLIWNSYLKFGAGNRQISCTLFTIRNLNGGVPAREDIELVRGNIAEFFKARETLGVFTWYSINELLMMYYGDAPTGDVVNELNASIHGDMVMLSMKLETQTISS